MSKRKGHRSWGQAINLGREEFFPGERFVIPLSGWFIPPTVPYMVPHHRVLGMFQNTGKTIVWADYWPGSRLQRKKGDRILILDQSYFKNRFERLFNDTFLQYRGHFPQQKGERKIWVPRLVTLCNNLSQEFDLKLGFVYFVIELNLDQAVFKTPGRIDLSPWISI